MIVAAQVLGCSVFELQRQPPYWVSYAMLHLEAENYRDEEDAAAARHGR